MVEMPRRVRVYEGGPRDGLQNEAAPIPTATKRRFIELLVAAGLPPPQRNVGLAGAESLATYGPLIHEAGHRAWWTRGYVSTAFGCPYTGRVDPARAIGVAPRPPELGVGGGGFGGPDGGGGA